MKNIILQHWAGERPSWSFAAEKTVRKYSEKLNCEYELFFNYPLGKELGANAQKLHMLDEKYDEYDQVLMLDMDTIATRQYANVFDRPEIGVLHDRAMIGPHRSRTPNAGIELYTQGLHVFFGNFIKLKRDYRQKLREYMDIPLFASKITDHYCADEIILHYLLTKSNILEGLSYDDICMRCSGTSSSDIYFREKNRYDRKFCNQPEDSDYDASFIHFCRDRKYQLESSVNKLFEGVNL